MKPLTIGTCVRATAIADVGYANYELDDHEKVIQVFPVEPLSAVIVGQQVKYTGTFCPARGRSTYAWEDYEEAHLAVDRAVTFWQVKVGMVNKPILVRDEDLEVIEAFKLPRQGRKPKIIWPEDECLKAAGQVRLLDHRPLTGTPEPMLAYPPYEPKLY